MPAPLTQAHRALILLCILASNASRLLLPWTASFQGLMLIALFNRVFQAPINVMVRCCMLYAVLQPISPTNVLLITFHEVLFVSAGARAAGRSEGCYEKVCRTLAALPGRSWLGRCNFNALPG